MNKRKVFETIHLWGCSIMFISLICGAISKSNNIDLIFGGVLVLAFFILMVNLVVADWNGVKF